MADFAQLVRQYDGGDRAQFVRQYFDDATVTEGRPDDFGSAIGTVGTIVNPESATPDITLTPPNTGDISDWLQTYDRVFGLLNKTPVFRLDFSNFRFGIGTPASPWQMGWLYRDDSDPGTIFPRPINTFDNNAGEPLHVFSNNTPFTQDEIEIVVKPRFRYIDMVRAADYVRATPNYFQLPSADTDGVFNTVTLTNASRRYNTVALTTLKQNGIGLDDVSSQPAGGFEKLNFTIVLAQHSCEDQACFYGWKLIELYAEGTGTFPDWFRQHCRLHIYVANPSGRYYGAGRFTVEDNGNEDANRAWDDSGSEQINAVKSAITTDGYQCDVLLDFHGGYTLGNTVAFYYGLFGSGTAVDNFITRFNEASLYDFQKMGDVIAGSAGQYGDQTLNAQLSFAGEFPIAGEVAYPDMDAESDVIMLDYIEALKLMVDNNELVLPGGPAAKPFGAHLIDRQYAAIAANRLGGVLQ